MSGDLFGVCARHFILQYSIIRIKTLSRVLYYLTVHGESQLKHVNGPLTQVTIQSNALIVNKLVLCI